jgi:uncharacterized delta-60 repeat protein
MEATTAFFSDLARDPQGRLVSAGWALDAHGAVYRSRIVVARTRADGAIDKSFGKDGLATFAIGEYSSVDALTVLPNGKLILTGTTDGMLLALRLLSNGQLDKSFGAGGLSKIPLGLPVTSGIAKIGGRSGAVDAKGRILLASGYRKREGAPKELALARLSPDGKPDPTFGEKGLVHTPLQGDAFAFSLLLDGEKIVLGGSAHRDLALARYDSHGNLDPSFARKGIYTRHVSDSSSVLLSLTKDAHGNYLGAAEAFNPTSLTAARLTHNGEADRAFGKDGLAVVPLPEPEFSASAAAIAIDREGKPLVAGTMHDACNSLFFLARLLPSGQLDPSFGIGGRVVQIFRF